MALQALEQVFNETPGISENNLYTKIDKYEVRTTALYAPFEPIIKPLGSVGSGLNLGGKNVLRKDLGYGLQERYDFSGHDGTEPHLNYDLLGANKKFSKDALGDAHFIGLFKK